MFAACCKLKGRRRTIGVGSLLKLPCIGTTGPYSSKIRSTCSSDKRNIALWLPSTSSRAKEIRPFYQLPSSTPASISSPRATVSKLQNALVGQQAYHKSIYDGKMNRVYNGRSVGGEDDPNDNIRITTPTVDSDKENRNMVEDLSVLAAFVLSLCTVSLLFDKDESTENSSRLPDISQLFSVHAAQPFKDDDDGDKGESKNLEKIGISKRERFNFIADVLETAQGAVVGIEVKDHTNVNWYGIPHTASNGSGFIIQQDGLILTNAHVVASQQRCSLSIKLQDGRCFAGYIEDVDYESDLATVRVNARGLPTLKLGCSADTRIGEWVVAVGSPLNLSNTVTAGIVSSTRRGANELGIHANDINYIQTDAAITFGNSGGPLINLDGEAIGINSMKVTPGISFAIPIDHAKKFLKRAELRRSSGKMKSSRPYMGLTILTLTDQIRAELETRTGVPVVNQGVFVWQVVRGGPAFLAGLQPGDIITAINGQPMRSAGQVHELVKTDDKLLVDVRRGSTSLTFTIVPEHIN